MDLEDFEEKTLTRKDIFKGQVIDVKLDEVALPKNMGIANRELVLHPGGVGMLALTENKEVIMVRQFRKALEEVIYEIPAGKLEPGEKDNTKEAALRELEEETGYMAENVELISKFYTAPGFSDEIIYLYQMTDLVKVVNPASLDDDEFLEVETFSLDECKEMISEGKIVDGKTLIALQHLIISDLESRGSK